MKVTKPDGTIVNICEFMYKCRCLIAPRITCMEGIAIRYLRCPRWKDYAGVVARQFLVDKFLRANKIMDTKVFRKGWWELVA